jgi:hypothetical protein
MRTSIEAIKNTSFASRENRFVVSGMWIWATHRDGFKPLFAAAHSSVSGVESLTETISRDVNIDRACATMMLREDHRGE